MDSRIRALQRKAERSGEFSDFVAWKSAEARHTDTESISGAIFEGLARALYLQRIEFELGGPYGLSLGQHVQAVDLFQRMYSVDGGRVLPAEITLSIKVAQIMIKEIEVSNGVPIGVLYEATKAWSSGRTDHFTPEALGVAFALGGVFSLDGIPFLFPRVAYDGQDKPNLGTLPLSRGVAFSFHGYHLTPAY